MYSEDVEDMECMYRPDTPEEVNKADNSALTHALPSVSKDKYNKVYNHFQKWKTLKRATSVSEEVLLDFFSELAKTSKPSTLWVQYSMLKATLRLNDNIDISSYSSLLKFLKRQSDGYKPDKIKNFTAEEIQKFIIEAPDEDWLAIKVVCIFGIHGMHSARKLLTLRTEHIKQYEDMFFVTVPKTETSVRRTFTITGTFFSIVQKYSNLRPGNIKDNRFFVHYREGECKIRPIGIHKLAAMPRKIAKYLKLAEPERYTVLSFQRTSNKLKTNVGGCSSTSVNVHDNGHRLDYETGHLKSPSIGCVKPSYSAATLNSRATSNSRTTSNCRTTSNSRATSNFAGTSKSAGTFNSAAKCNSSASKVNDNKSGAHICTLSCAQVKCAFEENELSVLHSFSVLKPLDYNIIEISPSLFASDPACRWIVSYTHITEPVSSVNADETFEDITRSIPQNVRIVQKYIRRNSSQLFAAYVVVYGVNCQCHKLSYDPLSTQPPQPLEVLILNEIKREV